MDFSGILVHLSGKTDRIVFIAGEFYFSVYCNEISAVGFKKAILGDFLVFNIKEKYTGSFVNRLKNSSQFNKLPPIVKPNSATLIYHAQSEKSLDHFLQIIEDYDAKQYATKLTFHLQGAIFGRVTLLLGGALAAFVYYGYTLPQNLLVVGLVIVMAFSAFRVFLLPLAVIGALVGWITSLTNTAIFLWLLQPYWECG